MLKNSLWKLFILVLNGLVVSCNTGHNTTADLSTDIFLNPDNNILTPNDLIEVVGWKALRVDSCTWTGNLSKIERMDGDYYIFENYPNKCVYRFTSDGQMQSKIGRIGNAEGEYINAYDFSVDEKDKQILILSDNSTVNIYRADGSFAKKIKLPDSLICNIYSKNSYIYGSSAYADLTNDGTNYLIYMYSMNGKIKKHWLEYDKVLLAPYSVVYKNPFIHNNDNLYYVDRVKFNIYDVNNFINKVEPYISFRIDNPMPIDIFSDTMKFMEQQGKHNWIMDVSITDSSILVSYIFDGKYCVTQTDKGGNIITTGNYKGYLPIDCCSVSGDTIISVIPISQYQEHWRNNPKIKQPNFKVSDNTILLMQWRLKTPIRQEKH